MSINDYVDPDHLDEEDYDVIYNTTQKIVDRPIQIHGESLTIKGLRYLTVFFDTFLMGCGVCFCISGWRTHNEHFMIFHLFDLQYQAESTFLTCGFINLILALLGFLGARCHIACFLTIHNIVLLLLLYTNGIIIYIYTDYLRAFVNELLRTFYCTFNIEDLLKEISECCCHTKVGKRCWPYNGNVTTLNTDESCDEYVHQNVQDFQQITFYFLSACMVIQALAMIFGYLVVMLKNRHNRAQLKRTRGSNRVAVYKETKDI